MGAVETPAMRCPSVLPDYAFASAVEQPHRVAFGSRWLTISTEIVSAYGDIDATNAGALTEYALGEVISRRGLILDLRGVGFCGTEGFVALHRIAVCCAAAGTRWAIVPGPAVSRLLAICDPTRALPHAATMNVALRNIRRQRHLTHQPELSAADPRYHSGHRAKRSRRHAPRWR
jgi:anti-anti-sigma regulatory factor